MIPFKHSALASSVPRPNMTSLLKWSGRQGDGKHDIKVADAARKGIEKGEWPGK
jgi:hypothetical protein